MSAPRKKRGPPPGSGGRPRAPRAKVTAALELVAAEGITAEEAAERVGLGGTTIRRALREPEAPPVAAPPAAPAPAPTGPATVADRQVDELVAKSRTWLRVQEALKRFAARHPEVAEDLAAELESIKL